MIHNNRDYSGKKRHRQYICVKLYIKGGQFLPYYTQYYFTPITPSLKQITFNYFLENIMLSFVIFLLILLHNVERIEQQYFRLL